MLRAYNLKEKHHTDDDQRLKSANKINGLTWAGCQHGSTYTGHYPVTFGSFTYMIEGSKYMASMDLNELSELYFSSDKGSADHDIVNDPARLLQDMGQPKLKTKSVD